ncbi:hypothetical protein M422DRAFT_270980 [Sphaerobolus stellatus SS14]|uniref:Unplaced genomic scaffold SPHSTscaffold_248, whole genome shotgun sequence n=1 Tax=Sphaerobolus stellatus (strain SS14) TaxID=990650 RepID=A0A0C9TEQ3_SPHS4|nr:hypothetical protein M422DRAFT_270980 [Sphaerobolus stellatus SS14]
MTDNTEANKPESFSLEDPPKDTRLSTAKAGTLKVLDISDYLDEDIDLPPSPTRSTTKGPILLGANILSSLPKKPKLRFPPEAVTSIFFPNTTMPQGNLSQAASTSDNGITPPPPGIDGEASGQTSEDPANSPHPPPLDRLPTNIRSRFISPVGAGWSTIYCQTLERIMHPIIPAHQRDWKTLDGNKILAVISRLKVTRNAADRVAAMMAPERLLKAVLPANVNIDIILGDTIQEHDLQNEFVLATEDVAVFFYPYDTALPTTDYAISLVQNDARAASELVRFLSGVSEVTHFIAQYNDNIPFNEVPNPHNFVRWTLNTLRVTSSMVKRRNTGPTPVHNIFIPPPTTEPAAYKKWITLLHRLHFDTRKGTGKPSAAELCNVCKSVAHSEDTCSYAAIPGWPTTPPSGKPIPTIPRGEAPLRAGDAAGILDTDGESVSTRAGPNGPHSPHHLIT